MKKIILTLLFFCGSLALSHAQGPQNVLTPEKLWQLGRVSDVQLSPDRTKVLFGVTYYELAENKGNRDLYIMNLYLKGNPDGTLMVERVTDFPGGEYNARWRPDGNRIGFLSGESGSMQLWEVNPDGSDIRQVTNINRDIGNFAYAPDGKHISFTMDVPMDPKVQDLYPDLPMADARIIDDLMYRHWNQWNDYAYSHIFFMDYYNGQVEGEETDIMEGQRYDSPMNPFGGTEHITWSPDGKHIAYTCKKKIGKDYAESTNSEIYLYNIDTRKTENLTEGMMGYDVEPVFTHDGKQMLWLSMEREGFESDRNRLFIMDLNTKKKTELTEGFDQSAGGVSLSKDGNKIYFLSGIDATYQIYMIDLKAKKMEIKQLTEGPHNYTSVAEAANGRLIATRMDMSMPTEIYEVVPESGKATNVSGINKDMLSQMEMGKVEKRMIETTDGKQMLTWVIYPPGFDPSKKYPTILYCQGGPQSAVSQFFSYRWNFQLMAANGYIVVAPNRRGLPTFGQAWNDEISKDWGGQAMKDYLSAIDKMKAEPFVDEDKLGCVGASYGGYSVYYLAGIHEGRFKTFISHCGLFNLESWYGTTEELFFANWDIGGPYWEKSRPQSYDKFSPHKLVGNWDTPILVIHNEKDFRVPLGEGMQAFQAAQIKGIPSRFLYYPNEGHWVLGPQNGVLWHRVFFDWLARGLKEGHSGKDVIKGKPDQR